MALNNGKKFEAKFKEDWLKAFPHSFLLRLHDQVSGYKVTSQNPCDFIGYVQPNLYLLECKSYKGNTFPWTALTQYDKLTKYVGIEGVRTGAILWMQDHDIVIYLPISSITAMMNDGCKSFNVKMLKEDKYKILVIPSIKKRIFMESDYTVLKTLVDGE